jgi:hypothetical protein
MVTHISEEHPAPVVKVEKDADAGEMYEYRETDDRGRSPDGNRCCKGKGKNIIY